MKTNYNIIFKIIVLLLLIAINSVLIIKNKIEKFYDYNNRVPILLYTHSEYSFLWKATIGLLDKYAKNFDIYWCCDKLLDYKLPEKWKVTFYDESLKWSLRVKQCSDTINSEYLIYIQEDWLLIDHMEEEKVNYIVNFMKEKNCEFMMCYDRDGIKGEPIDTIYEDYVFQETNGHWLQPAIWKKTLFDKFLSQNIAMSQSEVHIIENTRYFFTYNKRFPSHLSIRCLFFPHMHAIKHNAWLFYKYPTLKSLIESYGIDTNLNCNNKNLSDKWSDNQ